jgi:hypothetical protein
MLMCLLSLIAVVSCMDNAISPLSRAPLADAHRPAPAGSSHDAALTGSYSSSMDQPDGGGFPTRGFGGGTVFPAGQWVRVMIRGTTTISQSSAYEGFCGTHADSCWPRPYALVGTSPTPAGTDNSQLRVQVFQGSNKVNLTYDGDSAYALVRLSSADSFSVARKTMDGFWSDGHGNGGSWYTVSNSQTGSVLALSTPSVQFAPVHVFNQSTVFTIRNFPSGASAPTFYFAAGDTASVPSSAGPGWWTYSAVGCSSTMSCTWAPTQPGRMWALFPGVQPDGWVAGDPVVLQPELLASCSPQSVICGAVVDCKVSMSDSSVFALTSATVTVAGDGVARQLPAASYGGSNVYHLVGPVVGTSNLTFTGGTDTRQYSGTATISVATRSWPAWNIPATPVDSGIGRVDGHNSPNGYYYNGDSTKKEISFGSNYRSLPRRPVEDAVVVSGPNQDFRFAASQQLPVEYIMLNSALDGGGTWRAAQVDTVGGATVDSRGSVCQASQMPAFKEFVRRHEGLTNDPNSHWVRNRAILSANTVNFESLISFGPSDSLPSQKAARVSSVRDSLIAEDGSALEDADYGANNYPAPLSCHWRILDSWYSLRLP